MGVAVAAPDARPKTSSRKNPAINLRMRYMAPAGVLGLVMLGALALLVDVGRLRHDLLLSVPDRAGAVRADWLGTDSQGRDLFSSDGCRHTADSAHGSAGRVPRRDRHQCWLPLRRLLRRAASTRSSAVDIA